MYEKNTFEIELDFIVPKIRGVFGSVGGVCVCVCESKSWPLLFFLFCKVPILNDIRGHSDPKYICQIAGNRI